MSLWDEAQKRRFEAIERQLNRLGCEQAGEQEWWTKRFEAVLVRIDEQDEKIAELNTLLQAARDAYQQLKKGNGK